MDGIAGFWQCHPYGENNIAHIGIRIRFSEIETSVSDLISSSATSSGLWEVFLTSIEEKELLQSWLSMLCAKVPEIRRGLLLMEQGGSFAPAAMWHCSAQELGALVAVAQQCLVQRKHLLQHDLEGEFLFLAQPLLSKGQLFGAVVLSADDRSDEAVDSIIEILRWGSGWLECEWIRRQNQDDSVFLARTKIALDVLAVAAEQRRLSGLALAVTNDLASRFSCDRVALGVDRAGRARLVALSHSAVFEKKSQFVAGLENAMDEALDQRRSVTWPLAANDGDESVRGIAIAHRDFAGQRSVCSILLSGRGQGIGVLTFERNSGTPFSAEEVRTFEAIGTILGSPVENCVDLDHWFAGRLADKVADTWQHLKDPRRPAFRAATVMVVLFTLAILVIHGDYRVSAKSVVEGEIQRSLVAPFEGYIREAPVRAGMVVHQGQVLARLDDRDLILERQRWIAEREQHERRYRDALSRHERASAQVSIAQVAEAESHLALVEEKLARAQIEAPFDGVVVNGDLTQLLGSPVEQGKLLFELAPLDAYRVILKVEDRDIRYVHAGQDGRLVLTGLTGEVLDFKVHNISMAQAEEGKNLFRVEAKLERSDIKLRPGMEGVGKVTVGERSYAWIWTHRLFDWLRLQAWIWLP